MESPPPFQTFGPLPVLVGAVASPLLVTLASYLAGALHIVPVESVQGLNAVINKLLMPALLLRTMLTLDLNGIQPSILLVLLLAKLVLLALTWALVALFVSRRRLSKLGVYGLCTTLSNDIAVGLPIMQALYPQYQNYLLLAKPQQLLILNGIGLALLEVAQLKESPVGASDGVLARAASHQSLSRCALGTPEPPPPAIPAFQALLQIAPALANRLLLNPSLNTVALGLLVNAWAGPTAVPEFLLAALDTAGRGYTGAALIALGLSMVGKEHLFLGRALTWPLVLASLKCVALPFLTHAIGYAFTSDHELLGFLFICGAIPAGPHVFTFAAQYGACPDTVAASLVIGQFLSTAVILVGTLQHRVPVALLSAGVSAVSAWLALIATALVLPLALLLVVQPVLPNSPWRWLRWLVVSELCFSVLHWLCVGADPSDCFLINALHEYFRLQTSVWMCCLGVALVLHTRGQGRSAGQYARAFHLAAWGLPALCLLPILRSLHKPRSALRCILRPGLKQSITGIITLASLALFDGCCLVLARRARRPRPDSAPPDTASPFRSSSTGSLQYWTLRQRPAPSVPFSRDRTAAFFFRVRLVLVCEAVCLVFQIAGELSRLIGSVPTSQRSFFFLPFTFGMLLEQGQPILLVLVFGLEDHFLQQCLEWLETWGLRPPDSDATGDPSTTVAPGVIPKPSPALPYDDLLDLYAELGPLQRTIQHYRQCFLGSEAVDVILRSGMARGRAEAVAVGQQLLDAHLVAHVALCGAFADGGAAYRLVGALQVEGLEVDEGLLQASMDSLAPD